MTYIGPTNANYEDWRICSSIAIWEAAYLFNGHDPRVAATDLLANQYGNLPDHSQEHRAMVSAVLAGELILATTTNGAPTEMSHITMKSFITWLFKHGYQKVAILLSPPPPGGQKIRRQLLVQKHERNWTTITTDLNHSKELAEVAKATEHGYWLEAPALSWAKANHRLKDEADLDDAIRSWLAL